MSLPVWDRDRWERVTALFEQALELTPEQREAFMREVHTGDPDSARAVAEMLAADAGFTTDTPPSASSALAAAFDPVLAAGTRLGAYAIESCLGAGGMGRVYRAQRVDGDVAQTVAIKCLRFRERDPDFSRRFLRERRILARLNHPLIARFLDSGTDASGQAFVVMEYIDGVAITEFARVRRLPLRARIELLIKVMGAVAYSHRQLIVHRDLKPANVLVDAVGEPHLLDFGIAKPLAPFAGAVAAEPETAAELRAFSLTHAAPEQLRDGETGTACDIYALGVLAYELICEQAPLALTGLAFAAAERLILERFPAAPSARMARGGVAPDGGDGRLWQRAVRGDLDNIVLHALKKEPEQRYATVDAFIADLQRWQHSEPISLRGGQQVYRLQRFVRRHRLAVALAGSLVLALALGSITLWRQNIAIGIERDLARLEQARAEAISGVLLSAFEAADPSRNRGKDVTAREVLEQAARRVDDADLNPTTRSVLLTSVADVYRTLGLFTQSAQAAHDATRLEGEIPALLRARAWRTLAQARYGLGQIEAAQTALNSAVALPLPAGRREASIEAIEQAQVAAQILIGRGQAPQALEHYAALYARAQRELGPGDPWTIRSGASYAAQLRVMRMPIESGALVEELLRQIPDAKLDPVGNRLLGEQARYERELHQLDHAAQHAAEHMAGVIALYGKQHRSYVSALDLLAKIERDNGRYDQAILLFREMLEVLTAIESTSESATRALVLNNLANVLLMAERASEAVMTATQAVAMGEAVLVAGHPNIAHCRTTLVEALIARGEHAAALPLLLKIEAEFARAHTESAPEIVRAYAHVLRSEALLALGRRGDATSALEIAWPKLAKLEQANPYYQRALQQRQRLATQGDPVAFPSTQ
jgi:serine/threonine-protein kinase